MDIIGQECSICLETVKKEHSIGVIKCCRHSYHDKCIVQWSSNSNSCPTCRKSFHQLEIRSLDALDKIKSLISVKNKLLENDAINHIPREFVNPSTQETEIEREVINEICGICAISDTRSHMRDSVVCNFCGSSFHLHCLGIRNDSYEVSWCCIVCDSMVESVISRSRRNNARGFLQPKSHRDSMLSRTLDSSFDIAPPINNRTPSRPGLVIHNDNDELDDDFLYDEEEEEVSVVKPIINGGVILRKEQKMKNLLTEEEEKSWEMFEQALTDPVSSSSEHHSTMHPNRKKRKRKASEVSGGNASDLNTSNVSLSSKSRISCLIKQMKNKENTVERLPAGFSLGRNSVQDDIDLVESSPPTQQNSNHEDSSSDTSRETFVTQLELSLEYKNKIQRHVRQRLRPMYRPNKSGAATTNGLINNEESYIKINRSISRMIYKHILTHFDADGIDSLLQTNQEQLSKIVDHYVNSEFSDKHTNL